MKQASKGDLTRPVARRILQVLCGIGWYKIMFFQKDREQNGAKRHPKIRKVSRRVQQCSQRELKGSEREHKGSQKEANGSQKDPKGSQKGAKREPKVQPECVQKSICGKVGKMMPKRSPLKTRQGQKYAHTCGFGDIFHQTSIA